MKIEAKHSWGGGFSDNNEGMRWLLEDDNAQFSWCIGLMRNYMYIVRAKNGTKETPNE